jgi:hypothetical protein
MVAALASTSFLAFTSVRSCVTCHRQTEHGRRRSVTAAGFGQGAGPLAVGMLNDALKNDFGAQDVRYSAVGCGHGHGRGPVAHLGGGLGAGRYSAGELVRSARHAPLAFVFVTIFTKAHVAAAGFAVGQTICM